MSDGRISQDQSKVHAILCFSCGFCLLRGYAARVCKYPHPSKGTPTMARTPAQPTAPATTGATYWHLFPGGIRQSTEEEFQQWGKRTGIFTFQVRAVTEPQDTMHRLVGLRNAQVWLNGMTGINGGFIWEVPEDRREDFQQWLGRTLP